MLDYRRLSYERCFRKRIRTNKQLSRFILNFLSLCVKNLSVGQLGKGGSSKTLTKMGNIKKTPNF